MKFKEIVGAGAIMAAASLIALAIVVNVDAKELPDLEVKDLNRVKLVVNNNDALKRPWARELVDLTNATINQQEVTLSMSFCGTVRKKDLKSVLAQWVKAKRVKAKWKTTYWHVVFLIGVDRKVRRIEFRCHTNPTHKYDHVI